MSDTTSARASRSKVRINLLTQRLLELMESYPQLSVNAVATAVGWTQSSFGRVCQSREIEIPAAGRLSVEKLLAQYAFVRDYESIDALLDAIAFAAEAQTMELEDTEVAEVEPADAENSFKISDVLVNEDDYIEEDEEDDEDSDGADF